MKTLLEFLIAESKLQEGEENKTENPKSEIVVPPGYRRASVSGSMTKTGLAILKDLTGEDGQKYSDVKLTDVSVKNIKKKFGVPGNMINDLGDLCGNKGLFSKSGEGAQIMQQLFINSNLAGIKYDGIGGYRIEMHPDWAKMAETKPSSEKLIMFWLNALYNVYVNRNIEKIKLRYFFDDKSLIVQEP